MKLLAANNNIFAFFRQICVASKQLPLKLQLLFTNSTLHSSEMLKIGIRDCKQTAARKLTPNKVVLSISAFFFQLWLVVSFFN